MTCNVANPQQKLDFVRLVPINVQVIVLQGTYYYYSIKFVRYKFERYSVKTNLATLEFPPETIVGLVPRSPNIQDRNKFRASYTALVGSEPKRGSRKRGSSHVTCLRQQFNRNELWTVKFVVKMSARELSSLAHKLMLNQPFSWDYVLLNIYANLIPSLKMGFCTWNNGITSRISSRIQSVGESSYCVQIIPETY